MRAWVISIALAACDQGAKAKPTPTIALSTCSPASTWTPLATQHAPPASDRAIAHWVGSRLALFTESGTTIAGGLFDPCTNRWTSIAPGLTAPREPPVIAGRYIVWPYADNKLASIYDTERGTWRHIALTPPIASTREGTTLVWTGKHLIMWGGRSTTDYSLQPGGVRIDLETGAARAMSSTGEPTPRTGIGGVWLANRVVLWGGCGSNPNDGCGKYLNGATYDPVADAWKPIATPNQPTDGYLLGAAASRAVVYGPTGGATYDPIADQWTPVANTAPHSDWRLHGDYLVTSGQEQTLVYSIANKTWASVASAPRGEREHMVGVPSFDVRMNYKDDTGGAELWLFDPAAARWNRTDLPNLGVDGMRATVAAWTGTRLVLWTVLRRIPDGNGCENVHDRPCDPISLFRMEPTATSAMIDVKF